MKKLSTQQLRPRLWAIGVCDFTRKVRTGSQIGSHQSIGSAERHHDIIGGYARTLFSQVKENTQLEVHPKSRMFSWLIRFAAMLTSNFHVRKSGLTGYKMLTGNDYKLKLAPFAEQVLFKIPKVSENIPGKGVPKWSKGIFVGIQDDDHGYVVLTPQGFELPGEVNRMTADDR